MCSVSVQARQHDERGGLGGTDRLRRDMAMRQPGMFLSHPGSDTLASYQCAPIVYGGCDAGCGMGGGA